MTTRPQEPSECHDQVNEKAVQVTHDPKPTNRARIDESWFVGRFRYELLIRTHRLQS